MEVKKVSVRYGGVFAVRDLDLSVGERETVAIIGPNGAGKTSLLNAISGLVVLAGGEVSVLGRAMRGVPAHRLRGAGVARTFQHALLLEELSVLDNVMAGGDTFRGAWSMASETLRFRAGRRHVRASQQAARTAMERVGLSDLADVAVASLPFGQRKLVDIARAIVRTPDLLLLDEPTAGLTESEVRPLADVMRSLGHDSAILVVAHHMEFVQAVSNRVVCLNMGQKLAEGDAAAVSRDPRVVEAYLGVD